MTEDDLDKACAKVGRFLFEFARMEQELNQSIIQILELKREAADVVAHSIDFFKKVNILKIVARETAPKQFKKDLEKLLSDIGKQNDNRLIVAHAAFEPAADEAVLFIRTTATGGKVKKRDILWTKEVFESSYESLRSITKRVSEVRPTLTIDISEEGQSQLLTAYHYGALGGYY